MSLQLFFLRFTNHLHMAYRRFFRAPGMMCITSMSEKSKIYVFQCEWKWLKQQFTDIIRRW